MYIVHVFVDVKPEYTHAFREATLANAKASVHEPGIARFDVLQDSNDPRKFLLVEVYRTKEDPASHKETAHYRRWKNTVNEMMSAPRTKKIYTNIYPDESGWDYYAF